MGDLIEREAAAQIADDVAFGRMQMDDAPDAIRALPAAQVAVKPPRKQFPVLSSGGAKVDWQLVADHGEQARKNHYQTLQSLAGRGGLSWCELFAVLHNRPWAKMDTNEAMLACRALEAHYLAELDVAPVSLAEAARVLLAKWDADAASGLAYGPYEFCVLLRAIAGGQP